MNNHSNRVGPRWPGTACAEIGPDLAEFDSEFGPSLGLTSAPTFWRESIDPQIDLLERQLTGTAGLHTSCPSTKAGPSSAPAGAVAIADATPSWQTPRRARTQSRPMEPRNPLVTGAGKRSISLPKPSFPKPMEHAPVSKVLTMITASCVAGMRSGSSFRARATWAGPALAADTTAGPQVNVTSLKQVQNVELTENEFGRDRHAGLSKPEPEVGGNRPTAEMAPNLVEHGPNSANPAATGVDRDRPNLHRHCAPRPAFDPPNPHDREATDDGLRRYAQLNSAQPARERRNVQCRRRSSRSRCRVSRPSSPELLGALKIAFLAKHCGI